MLTRLKKFPVLATLVFAASLGHASTSFASTTCFIFDLLNCNFFVVGPVIPPPPPVLNAKVTENVVQTSNGLYAYQFTIKNTSTNNPSPLTNFYLPYFSDQSINALAYPYSVSTDSIDRFGLGHGAGSLQISGFSLAMNETSSSIELDSPFAPIYGPFSVTFNSPVGPLSFVGDPPIAGSPNAIAALTPATVPEPASLALFGLGLFGFIASRRKAKKD